MQVFTSATMYIAQITNDKQNDPIVECLNVSEIFYTTLKIKPQLTVHI